jgi:hypothetical protein
VFLNFSDSRTVRQQCFFSEICFVIVDEENCDICGNNMLTDLICAYFEGEKRN